MTENINDLKVIKTIAKFKTRVNEEYRIELSTICRRLKLFAKDGKIREKVHLM